MPAAQQLLPGPRRVGLLLFGLAHSMLAMAQTPAAPAAAAASAPQAACSSAAARQFDFWLGAWDVFLPDGSRAGQNRIEAVAGGCALLEQWQGRGGFSGSSLNRHDAADGRWHQLWVDSSGGSLDLQGGLQGSSMVLSGSSPDPAQPAQRVHERITWMAQPDGTVRQLWEQSGDGSRWRVVFDGRYVRQRPAL
jgi:hypothetical protein